MRIKLTVCSIVNCSVSHQQDQNALILGHSLTWGKLCDRLEPLAIAELDH